MAREQKGAAQCLCDPNQTHPSASASRSYYALYALLAAQPVGVKPPQGWNNPAHDQLPEIIRRLPTADKARLVEIAATLRLGREDADYRPHVSMGPGRAREMLRLCVEGFELLK